MGKYGHRTGNWLEAVVNKVGGEEAADRLLQGELVVVEVPKPWREENGVIYFSVISDGTTGENWITRLEGKGFRVSDYAKSVLRSTDFKPTNGVKYEVAVLKGELFKDSNRITSKIREEADKRKLAKPNAEIACLIREKSTDKEIEKMGLWWIVAMHEPIKDSGSNPRLLCARRYDGGRWHDVYCVRPAYGWPREYGFAFVVSQVGA